MCVMTFSVFQADASVSAKQHFRLLTDEENTGNYYTEAIGKINKRIISLVSLNDRDGLLNLADSLRLAIDNEVTDSATKAEYYYYIGVCYLLTDRYTEAISDLKQSVSLKKALEKVDDNYLKAIYNIGISYNYLGDYIQVSNYMLDYIDLANNNGDSADRQIAAAYSALIGAAVECKDFENFTEYANRIQGVLSSNRNAITGDELIRLYINIGVGFIRMGDYSKSRVYLEQAESLFRNSRKEADADYINLINSLAVTYSYLGLPEKEEEYYRKGIEFALKENSFLGFNMVNSYAIKLGNSGNADRGEKLLAQMVERAGHWYGTDSRYYIEVLNNYAIYLLSYKKDIENAIRFFRICTAYLDKNKEDSGLRFPVMNGYAKALYNGGQPEKALEKIQELLFPGSDTREDEGLWINPSPETLNADKSVLTTLMLKYEILRNMYSSSEDTEILIAAANTSELIVFVVDNLRINISEEESRLILSDRYRDAYLRTIQDFELCYRITGEEEYLEKAFTYSEKSKVAGLLAATRELNAIQLNIPETTAQFEKQLQREIGFYNARIAAENEKSNPDMAAVNLWKEKLLQTISVRDSLVLTFRRDYPGYFTMKYDTHTPDMNDIPSVIGRNYNYLSYVISDNMLYIFVVNRRHKELLSFHTDSLFAEKIAEFQNLLSSAELHTDARLKFENYNLLGHHLYKALIEPVEKYLISDNLLISPDNLLSYLPFETLLTSVYTGNEILYRKLKYLMNNYNISYSYSATFLQEVLTRQYRNSHSLVAFAPVYKKALHLDSIMSLRQSVNRVFYDLPYARQEAQYISGLSGGSVYLNDEARESVFKKTAGEYDIIHLAMHTFLNDVNPMNSAMIFMQDADPSEDGLLHTYEVYGIQLKALMVVLSSCNTGTGKLSRGEGILSLARGFLYSGSQSVVMSMWDIDDKSGTDIMKSFYDNLSKGMSKSAALRKARSQYLKNASQLKSHPYFWSSLVVYGANDPVFSSKRKILLLIPLLLIISVTAYFLYRRYS